MAAFIPAFLENLFLRRQTLELREAPHFRGCLLLFIWLSNDPEGPAGRRALTGLIQNDGQIPRLLATGGAGGISHQNLLILHAPQDDEVAA